MLLGDLGVAADLSEDSSQQQQQFHSTLKKVTAESALSKSQSEFATTHPTTHSTNSTLSAKHIRLVDPVQTRRNPMVRKRKSFVGTVSRSSQLSLSRSDRRPHAAMLDGSGAYPRKALCSKCRHLVFWYHCPRASSGTPAEIQNVPTTSSTANVSTNHIMTRTAWAE